MTKVDVDVKDIEVSITQPAGVRAAEGTRDTAGVVLKITEADEAILRKGFRAVLEANYSNPEKPLSPKEQLLELAAEKDYRGALAHASTAKLIAIAGEAAIKNNEARAILESYTHFKTVEGAENLLEKAVEADAKGATDANGLNGYIESPNAERLYEKALHSLPGNGLDQLSRQGFPTKEGDAKLLELADSIIETHAWIQKMIVQLMDRLPLTCLAYAGRFVKYEWYKDVLIKAAENNPELAQIKGVQIIEANS